MIGRLKFFENEGKLFENISVFFVSGHTAIKTIPVINYNDKKIVCMADITTQVLVISPRSLCYGI